MLCITFEEKKTPIFRQFYSYVLSKINTYFRETHLQENNNFLKYLKIKKTKLKSVGVLLQFLITSFSYIIIVNVIYKGLNKPQNN